MGWESLSIRRIIARGIKMFQIKKDASPDYPANIYRQFNLPEELQQGVCNLTVQDSFLIKWFFVCSWIRLWNRLDVKLKHVKTLNIFRCMIKKVYGVKSHLFNHNTNQKSQIHFT